MRIVSNRSTIEGGPFPTIPRFHGVTALIFRARQKREAEIGVTAITGFRATWSGLSTQYRSTNAHAPLETNPDTIRPP